MNEIQLIEACKNQDAIAQRKVYEKHASKMYAVCLRYLKSDAEAEDILTQGFLKVFSKINLYKGEGSFEGWIRRIMVNECLNHLRRTRAMLMTVSIEKAQYYEADSTDTLHQLEAEALMECLQRLPDGYRTVFNLYAIEGYSHKEIAELMNISEGTSKSQLSRARELLKKYIKDIEKTSNISRNA
ncbi:MAG: RNA polymerase sigma factor [Cytophagales bacterium]|nr:MAG: RNA polymerase sigma factor [Cytophagales bacterium]